MNKQLIIPLIIVFFVILFGVIVFTNQADAAEYATYMKVVGFNSVYVQVVDEDGQQWEVECITHIVKGKELKKGMNVLVIMDLTYDTTTYMLAIGNTYILDIL